MRVGIDVDDVCSNFQKRFVALLHEMYGRPPLDTAPIDWNWSNCQVSDEEMRAAWAKAATIYNMWQDLEPLPSFDNETRDYLLEVVRRHDVYFVTNRFPTPGASPMKQTKAWFWFRAGILSPNVMLAKDKGPMGGGHLCSNWMPSLTTVQRTALTFSRRVPRHEFSYVTRPITKRSTTQTFRGSKT